MYCCFFETRILIFMRRIVNYNLNLFFYLKQDITIFVWETAGCGCGQPPFTFDIYIPRMFWAKKPLGQLLYFFHFKFKKHVCQCWAVFLKYEGSCFEDFPMFWPTVRLMHSFSEIFLVKIKWSIVRSWWISFVFLS